MNYRGALFAVFAVAAISISGAIGYWWAQYRIVDSSMSSPQGSAADNRKVLYWYDPMTPNQHFDKPGKSPFMDMALQPKYAGGDSSDGGIQIDARVAQNLGIRLAMVERRALNLGVAAVGTIGFNERELAIVQARTNGFVSRVYALAPGDVVQVNTPIVDLQVPEWTAAQNEFLALRRSDDKSLSDAARERLHALGMSDTAIAELERSGQPQITTTIAAPIAGVLQTLNIRSGMTVSSGMSLAEINGLSTVWLTAAVPEALGGQIHVGDNLSAHLASAPQALLSGRVIAILPQTDAGSRTLAVRAEIPNRDSRLRPGQFATINFTGTTENMAVLTVPSEAIIRSGTRNVAIRVDNKNFQPMEVITGREIEGRTEIISGLEEGQQIVASGQFLIDSEANLTGVLARMQSTAENSEQLRRNPTTNSSTKKMEDTQ